MSQTNLFINLHTICNRIKKAAPTSHQLEQSEGLRQNVGAGRELCSSRGSLGSTGGESRQRIIVEHRTGEKERLSMSAAPMR